MSKAAHLKYADKAKNKLTNVLNVITGKKGLSAAVSGNLAILAGGVTIAAFAAAASPVVIITLAVSTAVFCDTSSSAVDFYEKMKKVAADKKAAPNSITKRQRSLGQ